MTAPTTLIVDFGGVLTTDVWESARSFAVREGLPAAGMTEILGRHPALARAFADLEAGRVDQRAFAQLLHTIIGLPPEGLLARMLADIRPDREMLAALASLRRGGIRIGVLSNSCGAGDFDPYAGYHLSDLADVVVISDQVGMRKPEPEIYQLTVDQLGVAPAACVFVDDTAVNLPPAEALGMRTVHHTGTSATLAALRSLFDLDLDPR